MIDTNEITSLRNTLTNRKPILFLGAGFSLGTYNISGVEIPNSSKLCVMLIDHFYSDAKYASVRTEVARYGLDKLCQCIESDYNRADLNKYLIEIFKGVVPTDYHNHLIDYNWSRIYTTNIDDLVENIFIEKKSNLFIQNKSTYQKALINHTELIKLHGCVNSPEEPFIFSKSQYSESMVDENFKFKLFCNDLFSQDFIFIGSSFDEENIDYFITKYRRAGFKSFVGETYFILPHFSHLLKLKIRAINGKMIEWKSQDFLNFISELNFDENRLVYIEKIMRQKGYYNLTEYKKDIDSQNMKYSSQLYFGYSPVYDDIFTDWDCVHPSVSKILDMINSDNHKMFFLLHGRSFVGKSCYGMRLAVELYNSGYDVIDFSGKEFDEDILKEYIENNSMYNKFAIFIEDASFFYKDIERFGHLFIKNNPKIIFITISNEYYHNRKRYIFERDRVYDLKMSSNITREYASIIYDKLFEKGFLGPLEGSAKDNGLDYITSTNDICELMFRITQGIGFRRYFDTCFNKSKFGVSKDAKYQAIICIAIFSRMGIAFYPTDMLSAVFPTLDIDQLIENYDYILDFDEHKGLKLRYSDIVAGQILMRVTEKNDMLDVYIDQLRYISSLFDERSNNKWRNIFEYLCKEKLMRKSLGLSVEDIRYIFNEIKPFYEDVSYYWLQLGLCEQEDKDYDRAYNHLIHANVIRPRSYQILHAIGRNFLRKAYNQDDYIIAKDIFSMGERSLLDLITSNEYSQGKAYSVHCFIFEKIRFVKKFNLELLYEEYSKMLSLIRETINMNDSMLIHIQRVFFAFCKEKKVLPMLNLTRAELDIALKTNYSFSEVFDNDID